jgi:PII-like signaling protein
MKITGQAKMLTIYLGESEKYKLRPLYEAIVYAAKRTGLSGVTVIRGIMSFGPNSKQIHTSNLFSLSDDLPVKIEIIDSIEKIEQFVETVEKMFEKSDSVGLISMQDIQVIRYKSNQ